MTIEQSFSARQVPWAKVGTVIDDPDVDAAEAARLGGIDFDVEVRPAGYPDRDGNWVETPTRRSIVHSITDEWFSYVSTDYEPVQFREAFQFMDNVNPRYVAAGSMSHGKQGFIVVQLPDHARVDVDVLGEVDAHQLYVVLQTSHDLSRGITISVTTLRDRCMNLLALPTFNPSVPQRWSIRHVGDPRAKLEKAHETLTNAVNYREVFERMVVQLASVRVTSDDLRQIANRVLPTRLKTRRDQVESIVDKFETAETVGFRETGWGALNAISEFQQWGRTSAVRTAQSEFTSPLDGDTAKYLHRAVQLIMARA